eukprot:365973-Chlamydomonas_euryale.AAC.9
MAAFLATCTGAASSAVPGVPGSLRGSHAHVARFLTRRPSCCRRPPNRTHLVLVVVEVAFAAELLVGVERRTFAQRLENVFHCMRKHRTVVSAWMVHTFFAKCAALEDSTLHVREVDINVRKDGARATAERFFCRAGLCWCWSIVCVLEYCPRAGGLSTCKSTVCVLS